MQPGRTGTVQTQQNTHRGELFKTSNGLGPQNPSGKQIHTKPVKFLRDGGRRNISAEYCHRDVGYTSPKGSMAGMLTQSRFCRLKSFIRPGQEKGLGWSVFLER